MKLKLSTVRNMIITSRWSYFLCFYILGSGRSASGTKSVKRAKETKNETLDTKIKDGDKESPDFRYWLMKSEPETRLENGIDVKVK